MNNNSVKNHLMRITLKCVTIKFEYDFECEAIKCQVASQCSAATTNTCTIYSLSINLPKTSKSIFATSAPLLQSSSIVESLNSTKLDISSNQVRNKVK